MKISRRDVKLLILLFGIVILALSYYFGYSKFNEKSAKIQEEVDALEVTYQSLSADHAKRDDYEDNISKMKAKIDEITLKYPAKVTVEKENMFVVGLEKEGVRFSALGFSENEIIYVSTVDAATTAAAIAATTAATTAGGQNVTPQPTVNPTPVPTVAPNTTQTADGDATAEKPDFIGHKLTTTITYETTYEFLKTCITDIVGYGEKKSIDGITIAFDSNTGNLTGNIIVSAYALEGMNTQYKSSVITDITTGSDNPFGSMELPQQ